MGFDFWHQSDLWAPLSIEYYDNLFGLVTLLFILFNLVILSKYSTSNGIFRKGLNWRLWQKVLHFCVRLVRTLQISDKVLTQISDSVKQSKKRYRFIFVLQEKRPSLVRNLEPFLGGGGAGHIFTQRKRN